MHRVFFFAVGFDVFLFSHPKNMLFDGVKLTGQGVDRWLEMIFEWFRRCKAMRINTWPSVQFTTRSVSFGILKVAGLFWIQIFNLPQFARKMGSFSSLVSPIFLLSCLWWLSGTVIGAFIIKAWYMFSMFIIILRIRIARIMVDHGETLWILAITESSPS